MNKTWICFDSFITLRWLNALFDLDVDLEYCNFITISYSFFKNRLGFCLFFVNQRVDYVNFINSLLTVNTIDRFSKNLSLFVYIDFIFDFFYCNYALVFFSKNYFNYGCYTFLISNLYFNKFVSYGFWDYNYNFLTNYNFINKSNIRSQNFQRHNHLMGFKLHCLGRFSRKQRVSSIWFKESKIPLNTLNADIDYGYFTVPLKNSSATVKIWLYKKPDFTKFYFKLL